MVDEHHLDELGLALQLLRQASRHAHAALGVQVPSGMPERGVLRPRGAMGVRRQVSLEAGGSGIPLKLGRVRAHERTGLLVHDSVGHSFVLVHRRWGHRMLVGSHNLLRAAIVKKS